MSYESKKARIERCSRIFATLMQEFPDSRCALEHKNAWELLVATVLSAQCTDKNVNKVTPALFERWPGPGEMAQASVGEIEEAIRTIGLFRSKAKNLKACAERMMEVHHGVVPQTLKELVALGGVGRKTANVVLGNAFQHPEGVVVDTHVSRISQLLKLTASKTPEAIERDLNQIVPQEDWVMFSHLLIDHGRKTCIARRPRCGQCPVAVDCPSRKPTSPQ